MTNKNFLFNLSISRMHTSSTVNTGNSINIHPDSRRVFVGVSFPEGDGHLFINGKENIYLDNDVTDQSSGM
ncbi:spore germination protein [Thermoflavimicrobium dichotomicum]|uniref:Spore germination protein gerPA/gerPF n=1 Tax=Thermoflavimicrobium dichotomicum TaxID=46223 RepID=A0A1I3JCH0_9BACL|nr:spore germination protein [Thermoflavimicrobium dichotomicum]SFI57678.1 Spore germination protein gerPA/gerPF [Thermoflavimicrobium dichotomicum]